MPTLQMRKPKCTEVRFFKVTSPAKVNLELELSLSSTPELLPPGQTVFPLQALDLGLGGHLCLNRLQHPSCTVTGLT